MNAGVYISFSFLLNPGLHPQLSEAYPESCLLEDSMSCPVDNTKPYAAPFAPIKNQVIHESQYHLWYIYFEMHISKMIDISYRQQDCLYLIYDASQRIQMCQIA